MKVTDGYIRVWVHASVGSTTTSLCKGAPGCSIVELAPVAGEIPVDSSHITEKWVSEWRIAKL